MNKQQGNEQWNSWREAYEQTEIPAELSQRVEAAIAQAKGEQNVVHLAAEGGKRDMRKQGKSMSKVWGSVAAALAICILGLGVGVNSSPAFAQSVAEIPLIGSIASIFTAEITEEESDAYHVKVEVPGIEDLADAALQAEINQLVQAQVDAAVAESKQMLEEHRDAYLATGGNQEDYVPGGIDVNYEVYLLDENRLSFGVFQTVSLASAYAESFYYNYDLNSGKALTLEDLLGADYEALVNRQVAEQIAARSQVEGNVYWDGSDGIEGFSGIRAHQPFYVNAEGNPVVVFYKYEIAPGYMGMQEFEILQ